MNPATPRICSFPPVATADARWLILGSMPGEASLAAGQYYAHPRNQFWPIMGELFGAGPEQPYGVRLELLQRHGIALWDVLESCVRSGSLDSAIVAARPNDFVRFFAEHPGIRHVFCNGTLAYNSFHRLVLPILPEPWTFELTRLPSTSPAHAAMSRADKAVAWRHSLKLAIT